MASGVQVANECKQTFEEMKLKHQHKYVIFKLSDDLKNIVVDCTGNKDETYEQFVVKLKAAESEGQGRYAVYDCDYDKDKPHMSKLVFIMWIPEGVPIRQKMLYTSSKKALMPKLQGIGKEMQSNDDDDLAWSNLVEKCQSKYD